MRITPALAFVAAFLALPIGEVLASPQAGLGPAPASVHPRACRAAGHHHKHKHDAPSAQPWTAPVVKDESVHKKVHTSVKEAAHHEEQHESGEHASHHKDKSAKDVSHHKKMHKKKSKDKCAVKSKGQDEHGQAPVSYNSGVASGGASGGSKKGSGPAAHRDSAGHHGPTAHNGSAASHDSPAPQGSAGQNEPQGYGDAPQPATNPVDNIPAKSSYAPPNHDQQSYGPPPTGYSSPRKFNETQGAGILCTGLKGSTVLPSRSSFNPHWFSPSLIHHGPGTQFGGPGLWEGGACMLDTLPHVNLPSIAMDQTFFQDGLACGTCVEIASTDASQFSNSAVWNVEPPKTGSLPAGKKTVAIVSDLCPGVDQCWSGLDMHLDAWNDVTHNAAGTRLPANWRFVNCKHAFENTGIKKLQVHWRPGANPGFFQVQIRGSHEAVVRVEMKWRKGGWRVAGHVDSSWWKWSLGDEEREFDQEKDQVAFRVTDWQGQTITSEVSTLMGTDLFFDANFESVGSKEGY